MDWNDLTEDYRRQHPPPALRARVLADYADNGGHGVSRAGWWLGGALAGSATAALVLLLWLQPGSPVNLQRSSLQLALATPERPALPTLGAIRLGASAAPSLAGLVPATIVPPAFGTTRTQQGDDGHDQDPTTEALR